MHTKTDVLPPMAAVTQRHFVVALGPLTLVTVVLGYSPLKVGQFWGRLAIAPPGNGYLFMKVDVLGKTMLLGSFMPA
jgi:hypothetical protein